MSQNFFPPRDRRAVLLGAGLAAAAAAIAGGHATGLLPKLRQRLVVWLFNPFSAEDFALAPLPGLTDFFGAPVPSFSSAEIAGKAVTINVFASWCPHCAEEHAALMEFARSGARIYGVAAFDEPDRTLAFLKERGNPYVKLGLDRHGYLLHALGGRGVPASFVLAPAPKLALKVEGPMDFGQMRDKILPALAKPVT